MHLVTLNLTDLFINLMRGTLHCDGTDDRDFWDFACLRDKDVWREHGKLVADSTRYLPGSFGRPPRNPAEKISSGYKAWEFSLYNWGFLPGFLRHLLLPMYYIHFCKLVFAIRILLQYEIHVDQLRIARQRLVEHAEEFETLYCKRRPDRMHFVRPSVHASMHMAPEAYRAGPGSLYSQWAMENYIGNITREMKQHVTPYANVSERALARCQVNALMSLYPSLAPADIPPRGSVDLGDGFRLLRRQERSPHNLTHQLEQDAILALLAEHAVIIDPRWRPSVQRWARLRLPNGQIARSAWLEVAREERGLFPRRARMLTQTRFVEVMYYFQYDIHDVVHNFAMVSEFSSPDPTIARETFGVLLACLHRGDLSRRIIDVKEIVSAVGMVPLPTTAEERARDPTGTLYADRYFVVEKPGLEVAVLGGIEEDDDDDDDDDDI
ncbi:uncharacterized protein TRAVEDRAFT_129723 [Trametes versicolor FP-101664 SS1]|uniref:uncharacterized protein n=1 Tax=Trametes versicolor (strain FP-101664) TaxID=717944 RepID=UPI0004621FB7|nr:uncharacterized protein TRAVEDRAFT_129723 [Trametes versicolor FP-101664 SS1]EIW55808.1 hypothetical protein TRAVEDRAFT_129723 [Trametes versicolor FP-101664 SS1]